jgi:adenylate cyclase
VWEEQGENLSYHLQARRWLEQLELRTYDWRARELGRLSKPSKEVVIVGMDDETLARANASVRLDLATQPWPREVMGGIVREMVDQGAQMVLVDFLFSSLSPRACSSDIPAAYGLEGLELDDDLRFRRLLDSVPGKTILAFSTQPQARKVVVPSLVKELALVDRVDTRAQALELVRKVLATRRPAFSVPEGKKVQIWAGVESRDDARGLLASLEVAAKGEPILRARTRAESGYEIDAADLVTALAEVHVEGIDPARLPRVPALDHPASPLIGAASDYGSVVTRADVDGLVRGMPHLHYVATRDGGRVLPSLPLAAAMRLAASRRLVYRDGRLHVGDRFSIPVDERGFGVIRWNAPQSDGSRGSLATFVSAWSLIGSVSDRVARIPVRPIRALKDRVVVFTNTSTQGNDFKPTPIGDVTPGGAILGQALANILSSDGIVRVASRWDLLAAAGMALIGALLALTVSGALRSALGALVYFASLLVVGAGYVAFAWWLFVAREHWIAIAGPLLAMGSTFLLTTIHAIRTEREVREFIFHVLGRSVSPEVARRVASDFSLIHPERREVTVYFSDLEGFTRISEQISPELLIRLLEEYFAEMTRLVRATGGHLDKFIGDAVMALWNAPNPSPNHAALACESALRMQEALARRVADWEVRYGHRIVARAGINTGEVVVGHVGSDLQAAYTAIGDAVNLASRLEGANKAYGTQILVGEQTVLNAREEFVFREVDRVRMRGKTVPTRVFELLGRSGDPAPRAKALLLFEQALALYHQRRFTEAGELFARCEAETEDSVAAVYVARCKQYAMSSPPPEWDGVYELTEK